MKSKIKIYTYFISKFLDCVKLTIIWEFCPATLFCFLLRTTQNPLSWIIGYVLPLTSFQIAFAILHSFVRTSYEFEASPLHSSDNPPLEFWQFKTKALHYRTLSYRFVWFFTLTAFLRYTQSALSKSAKKRLRLEPYFN